MTEKPKRPMSAYLLWLNSARSKIKDDNPGLKVTEIAKKAGEIWRSMYDKSEWEEKAAKAKEQYIEDLESFNANGGGPVEKKKKTQKRGKKAKPAPKSKKSKPVDDDDDDDDDDDKDDENDSE